MEDILIRISENLIGRLHGPLTFRFLLQPAIAIFFAVRAGLRDARENRPPYFWAVLYNPEQRSLRHLFIACTVLEVAVASLVAWLPALLMRAHGLKLSTTGALLAVVLGLLGAGGTLLGGWLSDRLGARAPAWRLRTTAIVVLLMAPVWALAIASDDDAIALVALIIAGALISFHLGPTFSLVQSLTAPRMRALTASLLLFIANLVGVGIGPYLVGTLSDAWLAEYGSNSLRLALMIVPPLFLWAAAHFTVAACWLAADLQNASAAGGARGDAADAAEVDHAGAHFR